MRVARRGKPPAGGGASEADAQAASSQLRDELGQQQAQLSKRTVDELQALLEYMEVDFDPALDDKEQLVQLVIGQKHLQAVAQTHAPALRKWMQRSASRLSLVAE